MAIKEAKEAAKKVVISGLGHLSALGQGKAALLEGLTGARAPRLIDRIVKTSRGDRALLIYQAPEVELPPDIPESVKRRMSRISKMYFATVLEAFEDAFGPATQSRDWSQRDPARTGIVVGTGIGCLEAANQYQRRVILEGPTGASPSLFASSIQNAIASHLSISLGVNGPTSTVSTMDQTTIGAFRLAYDWIQQDVVDHVIVTVGDEMSEYQPYALAHLPPPFPRRLEPTSDACSAIAGEGMASFVLSRAESGQTSRSYCEISEITLSSENCPQAERYLASAYGAEGQWARYKNWIDTSGAPGEILCHAGLYGSSPTGSVFEAAIGALLVSQDHRLTTCIQMTGRGEAQTLSLR